MDKPKTCPACGGSVVGVGYRHNFGCRIVEEKKRVKKQRLKENKEKHAYEEWKQKRQEEGLDSSKETWLTEQAKESQ